VEPRHDLQTRGLEQRVHRHVLHARHVERKHATIADTQLLVYKLTAASEAGCKMKSVTTTYLQRDEIKRGPILHFSTAPTVTSILPR